MIPPDASVPWAWLIAVAAMALLLIGAAWWMHVRYWVRQLTVAMSYHLEERIEADDGVPIELRHVPPAVDPPSVGLPPVLLVHGLGANHRNVDVMPASSLARSLAAAGRDVWLLTLRSGVIPLTRRQRARVRFGAMVQHDVPLAVQSVCDRTGRDQLDCVGFSMGGMLLFAALGRTVPRERVRRVVTIGSPGRVRAPLKLLGLLRLVPVAFVPGLRFRVPARTIAFAAGRRWALPWHHLVANPRNVSPEAARAALVNVVEDFPAALQADFIRWAALGGALRVDGEDVLDGMAGLDIPALFVAGAADRLASLPDVRLAYDAWGSRAAEVDKELLVLGTGYGSRADYGHGDLVVGKYAVEEVFGPVVDFLARG